MNTTNDPAAVDAYLAPLPESDRDALERVRTVAMKLVPKATQRVSYGVVVLAQGGDLVAFGAASNHLSLYTMSPPLVEAMKDDLERFEVSGSTIQFTTDLQLPANLIQKIVRARVKANKG
ncbi:MAG: DUF1801 domain-containing protein [Chloroflexi bacterium]|nr:DUF1801 domain-containing protein [Chloroflexota bacterium]MDA1146337.1 DUF1801 domain-containing protein [Chloroflexota bacterium]